MNGIMKDCETILLKRKGDWEEVVDDCRATVGKPGLGKEPSSTFKSKILIAEHSPIRDIIIRWRWINMPHWVVVHWVRHKWEKFVETMRTDRTGVDRNKMPQDEPSNMTCEANAQHLIDSFRKRLCFQASKETRESAEDLKIKLKQKPDNPVYEPELSDVLVPNCVYRCGCPEMVPCKHWEKFKLYCTERNANLADLTIKERYTLYNDYFLSRKMCEILDHMEITEDGEQ